MTAMRARTVRAWALAALAAVHAAAPTQGQAPAIDEAGAAYAAAAESLERVRVRTWRGVRDGQAEAVAAALAAAEPALDAADARAAAELNGAPPLAAPRAAGPDADHWRALAGRRLQIALWRAELLYLAARALPEAAPQRVELATRSAEAFARLRVEYRDAAMSALGYVGEARARLVLDDLPAAETALAGVLALQPTPGDMVMLDLRRTAQLESLEVFPRSDPARVAEEALRRFPPADRGTDPAWAARLEWLLARADAARLETLAAGSPPTPAVEALAAQVAQRLRSDPVVQVAPPHERLAALELATLLADPPGMAREELLAWADILASAGLGEAAGMYLRAAQMPGEPLSPPRTLACAGLLAARGDHLPAADLCDGLLDRLPANAPERPAVVQTRAACLLRAADPDQRPRLLAALLDAADADLPDAVRRDALRQWAACQAADGGPGSCVDALDARAALVEGDPYLLCASAAGQWQRLIGTVAAPDEAALAPVLARLDEAVLAADAVADAPTLDRAAMLRARILMGPPRHDPQSALQALRSRWDTLHAHPGTAAEAAWLHAELLLDLGLTDDAVAALAAVPDADSQPATPLLLRLAETLAQRYAGADAQHEAVRGQVVRLCGQALAGAAGGAGDHAAATRRAARAMLRVEAFPDVEAILRPRVRSGQGSEDVDAALLLAEALVGGGRLNDGLALLDDLVARFPRSAPVQGALGRCRLRLDQPERAAEAFRQARRLTTPGRTEWCEATLDLANALRAAGHEAAAEDILRVSVALYPQFGSPELLARLRRMRSAPDGRTR